MSEAYLVDSSSHHLRLENVNPADGPNQVQLNNQARLDTEQLDRLILEQLKALTQEIVDQSALQQVQSSNSSQKHDASGSHEQAGSNQSFDLASGSVGK